MYKYNKLTNIYRFNLIALRNTIYNNLQINEYAVLNKGGYMNRLSKKYITAEWKEVNIYNTDITNVITDAMINNSIIKVNYKDSGWRNCLPYGWYITKDNNVIMYVYKEDLSIRSYRLDRVRGLFIDDKLDTEINNEVKESPDEIQEKIDELQIMELPDNNEEIIEISENEQGAETPFDESLEILKTDFEVPQNNESDLEDINEMIEQTTEDDSTETDMLSNEDNPFQTDMLTNASYKIKRLIREE